MTKQFPLPGQRRRGRPPSPRHPAEDVTAPRVEAVERALSLLEVFDQDGLRVPGHRLSLSEMAARAGFYPSTVQRLATSLIRFGYLQRDADGGFRLGPSLLRLGQIYRESFDLADHVRPALAALTRETGETSAFFVREGQDRICLFRHHSDRTIRHHVEEGMRLPLDRGASGHVLSAYGGMQGDALAAVRAAGYAISLGERDPEAAAIATPVFGAEGFVGALGIGGLRHRFDAATCQQLATTVMRGAAALTRTLGGRQPPAGIE
ncbi:MAG: IclR family transcriptional regulator [Azospirillum brasilense]|nr:MAG: IclR family transcriptional regulator [Azospirillum brasilense]